MNAPAGSYRELQVWQKAVELVDDIYDLSTCFPDDEKYALTSQIKRSSVSVAANIAEGHGRGSHRDYQRMLWIAHGSLKEMETRLIIAGRRGWIDRDQASAAWDKSQEIGRMLRGLIRSLD